MSKLPRRGQTDAWGIDDCYQDAFHRWHHTSDETRAALRTAMDADPSWPAPPSDARMLFLHPDRPTCTVEPGELQLETGEVLRIDGSLPGNLPFGYHSLRPESGLDPIRVFVCPDRCWLPENLKTWGWSVQLYAARSRKSWGIGDLRDLRTIADWSANQLGAGVLMINPLHATTPVLPVQTSPYYPGSRRYRNPLYLHIEDVPGARESGCDLEGIAAMAKRLNSNRLIDRDAVFRFKMDVLACIWKAARPDRGLDAYLAREGRDLEIFATFCALAERHGGGWQNWPVDLRHPTGSAVRPFFSDNIDRIRFHMWLQWLIDEQLARSTQSLAVMQDLPIGVDPGGADAWAWQDVFAKGVSVGAPPDQFNTGGQDWGLPPFIPWKLRRAGYEPFIQTIRSTLRHAGGLRIDHVLGLFRLYWVPHGNPAAQGAYVRYPSDELLSLVALESHRARAFVVGEDLGTVEDGVSENLHRSGILSYRVFWFENEPPSTYPELALSAISTHDLPTIAGMWTKSDIEAQRRIGLKPDEEATEQSRRQMIDLAGVCPDASIQQAVIRMHESLATAPSRVVTAQLDDALGIRERPNMPATMNDKWPNWSVALPCTLEEIQENRTVDRVAACLRRQS